MTNNNLKHRLSRYAERLTDAEPITLEEMRRPEGFVSARSTRGMRDRVRMPPYAYALVAAFVIVVAVGGAALITIGSQSGQTAVGGTDVASATGEDCAAATTLPPDGIAPSCPELTGRDEIARAAVSLLGAEGFGGMWFEDNGTTLVAAYVGARPDIEDLPGVDRLVERSVSLADLERLADQKNRDETGTLFWRVNEPEGTVEAIPNNPDDRPDWDSPGPDL